MRIPRHWRLNSQRYALQGVTCPNCAHNIFPPREVCPYCENRTADQTYDFAAVENRVSHTVVTFERAAR
ncbi:MAG: hypothetical protein Kow0077_30320 [Anaerolineae bacterium]